jgi:hypothetical protein
MAPSYSLPRQSPLRVASPFFFLNKGLFAGTQLPLASVASDFKLRMICQQKNGMKSKFHDSNELELFKRSLIIFTIEFNKLKMNLNPNF